MANELKNFYKNYLNIENEQSVLKAVFFGISRQERDVLLNNWRQFEKPDIINISKNCTYGIEHFEYDSYANNRNGSIQRKEYSKINASIEEEVKEKIKDKTVITTYREMISRPNSNNYKNNFIKIFKDHYSKVPKYKKHLLQESPANKTSVWFLAEDATPLGSHFFYNNKKNKPTLKPVLPIFFPEIEKLFLKCNGIDGIIFADNYYKILSICKRDKKAIEDLKESFDYNCEPIEFFNPKIISTTIKIMEENEGISND